MTIRDLFFFLALSALTGWVLVIGKTVILPFVIAVMLTYVLVGATKSLRRVRPLSKMPDWLAYVLVLSIFGLTLTSMSLIVVSNLRNITQTAPAAEANLLALIGRIGRLFGVADAPSWSTLREVLLARIDLPDLSLSLLTSVASAGGYTVLISTYIVFMVAERRPLSHKVDLLFPDTDERGAARKIFDRINSQIVTYLFTKTLINAMLGLISYVLMWLMGIENAVFWAFSIGLFNYIPYVGSAIGVGVVITYLAVTTGALGPILLALVLLTAAQVYVGNWLEPRVMSRSLNLSPLTVLVALVVWSALWGLIGAIIAVPMTSILMIVLAAFDSTRGLAILASRDGELT
ncbi:MAG: AI-2E family transporter [Rhodobacteraceae bacterium]|nr:AI-2E family transporter [Paracoccaceae bacterium]